MKIIKKEDSVLVELSQAELSAIRFMADNALEAGSAVLDIEVEASMRNEGTEAQPETPSAYSTLMYCYEFLGAIGNHAENDEVDIRAFASLFSPLSLEKPSPLE